MINELFSSIGWLSGILLVIGFACNFIEVFRGNFGLSGKIGIVFIIAGMVAYIAEGNSYVNAMLIALVIFVILAVAMLVIIMLQKLNIIKGVLAFQSDVDTSVDNTKQSSDDSIAVKHKKSKNKTDNTKNSTLDTPNKIEENIVNLFGVAVTDIGLQGIIKINNINYNAITFDKDDIKAGSKIQVTMVQNGLAVVKAVA